MKKIRKVACLLACASAAVLFVSCNNANANKTQAGGTQEAAPQEVAQEAALQAVVDGNTLTYGEHSYTVSGEFNKPGKIPTAFVTFTNIPSDYEEFEAVYNGLLGKSIQGAASMIPMAIELYARDAEVGKRCFDLLCNSSATVSGIVRILKTKLVPSQYAQTNDPYIQRYMAAALLKGANAANAYSPDMPYTVEMAASPNGSQKVSDGSVTFIYIIADGWDTKQRGVDVFQEEGSEYFKVYNCPSCYVQCKNIKGEWGGLQ